MSITYKFLHYINANQRADIAQDQIRFNVLIGKVLR